MKALFDASSILMAIRRYGSRAYEVLRGSYTISLALYKVGNAVWKESTLLGTLSVVEAKDVLKAAYALIERMNIVAPRDPILVLTVAHELRTTFYDSAYVVAASENHLTLITEDKKLARKVNKEAKRLAELLGEEPRVLSLDQLQEPG
ncbi:type II toxin-antitoxin system VapC family toxin [Pyrodictium abyssi]|uniref:RNase VapC n=1 Tax=Pyrodictium abyssi TaxID=54256 RepID=A0ABN6ZUZ9_9CREN|nr:hypothetical protein PABY_13150 [Pyrodictium abyssi]